MYRGYQRTDKRAEANEREKELPETYIRKLHSKERLKLGKLVIETKSAGKLF